MKIAAPALAPVVALPLLVALLALMPVFSTAAPHASPRHATAELVSARINAALEGKAYSLDRR